MRAEVRSGRPQHGAARVTFSDWRPAWRRLRRPSRRRPTAAASVATAAAGRPAASRPDGSRQEFPLVEGPSANPKGVERLGMKPCCPCPSPPLPFCSHLPTRGSSPLQPLAHSAILAPGSTRNLTRSSAPTCIKWNIIRRFRSKRLSLIPLASDQGFDLFGSERLLDRLIRAVA